MKIKNTIVLIALLLASGTAIRAEDTIPDRYSYQEEQRQERIELRKEAIQRRDEARRRDHFVIGPALSIHSLEPDDPKSDWLEAKLPGIYLGYRTHTQRRSGYKLGAQLSYGDVSGGSNGSYGYSADGSMFLADVSGQWIIGPFGRLAFEPGLGASYGMYKLGNDNGYLSGRGGVQRSFTCVSPSVGVSMYLGSREDLSLTMNLQEEFDILAPKNTHTQFGFTAAYAFEVQD
jgi:hypothetical protein